MSGGMASNMPKGVDKRVRVSVCLDREDYEYLLNLARSHGLSFSDTARLAIRQWITDRKERKKAQAAQKAEATIQGNPP